MKPNDLKWFKTILGKLVEEVKGTLQIEEGAAITLTESVLWDLHQEVTRRARDEFSKWPEQDQKDVQIS